MNLYLRRGRAAVPDGFLYLRMPTSKLPRAGSYVVPRDGAPELVIEILSASDVSYADDEGMVANKTAFYQTCGVKECWIYDPETCRQDRMARLEGFRLRPDGVYAHQAGSTAPLVQCRLGHGLEPGGATDAGAGSVYRPAVGGPANGCLVLDDRGTRSTVGRTQSRLGSLPGSIRALGSVSAQIPNRQPALPTTRERPCRMPARP